MQDPLLADCFCPVTAAEAWASFAMDDDKERKERDGEGVRKMKYWIKLWRQTSFFIDNFDESINFVCSA